MAENNRKTIELRPEVIEILKEEANKEKRVLKNHLEFILDKYASKLWSKKFPNKPKPTKNASANH